MSRSPGFRPSSLRLTDAQVLNCQDDLKTQVRQPEFGTRLTDGKKLQASCARGSVLKAVWRHWPFFSSAFRARVYRLFNLGGLLFLAVALSGCVSKATAQAQARAAFLAGQQQAMERMQQSQAMGPTVTCLGQVKNNLIPWTANLTLAKAILAAEYYGPTDPKEIVVVRGGQQMRVDPKQLLNGNDVPLEPHDVIELRR